MKKSRNPPPTTVYKRLSVALPSGAAETPQLASPYVRARYCPRSDCPLYHPPQFERGIEPSSDPYTPIIYIVPGRMRPQHWHHDLNSGLYVYDHPIGPSFGGNAEDSVLAVGHCWSPVRSPEYLTGPSYLTTGELHLDAIVSVTCARCRCDCTTGAAWHGDSWPESYNMRLLCDQCYAHFRDAYTLRLAFLFVLRDGRLQWRGPVLTGTSAMGPSATADGYRACE